MNRTSLGRVHPTWLLLAAAALTQACAASESSQVAALRPMDDSTAPPRLITRYPAPQMRLTRSAGSLCPEGSVGFSISDGDWTLVTSVDQPGTQSCELHFALSVPAGYRFRRPIILAGGLAAADAQSAAAPARVRMTYGFGDTPLTSEHVIPYATEEDASESFLLTDTPDLTVPECSDPSQPIELDLLIGITVEVPEEAYAHITALDGRFNDGVEWTTCRAGFQTRP